MGQDEGRSAGKGQGGLCGVSGVCGVCGLRVAKKYIINSEMKICVFMSDNRPLAPNFEKADYNSLAASINYEYCKLYGYDFIYYRPYLKDPSVTVLYNCLDPNGEERHASWSKLLSTTKVLEGGDDYVVYVNDVNNPSAINGFRTGMNWYNSSGTPVEDPKVIRGAAGIAPWLTNPSQETPNETAFEDYKAQVNVMPRIAFSFPISDEASFFAHYDVLTKRPTTGFRFNPYEYQFIQTRNAVINNANLKPETTVDYELGFQQVLSRTSSLKISAFYREQRNNVQLVNMFEAYPATYRTYGNRDFGTVKGMTVSYDLRQTGNVRLTAAYTLQFADGTGSNANTAAGLINAGLPNLRNIFPYDFDQRHAFNITFDYRYGEGENYSGPVIGNK